MLPGGIGVFRMGNVEGSRSLRSGGGELKGGESGGRRRKRRRRGGRAQQLVSKQKTFSTEQVSGGKRLQGWFVGCVVCADG